MKKGNSPRLVVADSNFDHGVEVKSVKLQGGPSIMTWFLHQLTDIESPPFDKLPMERSARLQLSYSESSNEEVLVQDVDREVDDNDSGENEEQHLQGSIRTKTIRSSAQLQPWFSMTKCSYALSRLL